jgi:very-short-patch-repair endonuclease
MSKNDINITGTKSKWQGFETADLILWEILKENSKANRRHPTEAENMMWQLLRNNKTGYKIRRQHAIDGYIADFVCLGKGLVIEIDGGYHLFTEERDDLRTSVLNKLGFHVIRFTNDQVLRNPQNVFLKIKEILAKQPNRKI